MSNLFRFLVSYSWKNIVFTLAVLVVLTGIYNNAIAPFFSDGIQIDATGSLQSVEISPVVIRRYEDLVSKFETKEILEFWKKQETIESSDIPTGEAMKLFSSYAEFRFPEVETIKTFGKTELYKVTISNVGNMIADDVQLISSYKVEKAIVELATGAGFGSPQYEIVEHDGKQASLGPLLPNDTMEIRVWNDSYILPSALSLLVNGTRVDIIPEMKFKSREQFLTLLAGLVFAMIVVNWIVKETILWLVELCKKAWIRHKDDGAESNND